MVRSPILICACFIGITATTSPAVADPIHIMSGQAELGRWTLQFALHASNFSIGGGNVYFSDDDNWKHQQPVGSYPLQSGAAVYLSTHPEFTDAFVRDDGGSPIAGLRLVGDFTFTSGRTTVACSSDECISGDAPFSFTGRIREFDQSNALLFDDAFIGRGRASGSFDKGNSRLDSVRYLFEPSPVPEPSTLFLLGSGILACLGRVKNRLAP